RAADLRRGARPAVDEAAAPVGEGPAVRADVGARAPLAAAERAVPELHVAVGEGDAAVITGRRVGAAGAGEGDLLGGRARDDERPDDAERERPPNVLLHGRGLRDLGRGGKRRSSSGSSRGSRVTSGGAPLLPLPV